MPDHLARLVGSMRTLNYRIRTKTSHQKRSLSVDDANDLKANRYIQPCPDLTWWSTTDLARTHYRQ